MATGAAAVAVSAGLLTPSVVLANWNAKAFEAKTVNDALQAALGASNAANSGDVKLTAPAIAENGAVTPVTVDATAMKGVEAIAIVASKNPTPLVATYNFTGAAKAFASTRIRLGETQNIVGVAKAGGKLFKAEQEVRVTIGGCGG